MRLPRSKRLFIYCAGGQGRETLKTARAANAVGAGWEEVLFIDDGCAGGEVNGVPVLSLAECLERFGPGEGGFQIASGEPSLRRRLAETVLSHGRRLETVVHPTVELSPFHTIGEGAFLGERVTLSDNLDIGICACLNAGTIIGHYSSIGAYVVVSPGAVISGGVSIGNGTYIGTGAVLRDEITIGEDSVIGMGSIVTKDIPAGVVVYGSPCRVVRKSGGRPVFGTASKKTGKNFRGAERRPHYPVKCGKPGLSGGGSRVRGRAA